ncbi:MAG TPA: leucyl aminopeptidase [Candidatus Thermoplasmatota archaeon]|nr:leucyl aminopeptidase [Candidatus Thermoplasmatota archaeon]
MAKPKPAPTREPPRRRVEVAVEKGDLARTPSDLLIVDAYEGVESFGGVTAEVDEATGGALSRVVRAGDFRGKWKESVLVHPAEGPAKRVLLVGMGKLEKLTKDRVRRIAAIAARRARDLGVETAHSSLHGVRDEGGLPPAEAAEAVAEGALLGLFRFDRYKGRREGDDEKDRLARLVLVERDATRAREAAAGAAAGVAIAEATNLCREWATLSGDDAAPERFGERVQEVARAWGLRAEALDKRRIEALGMGGLLAVNRGSAREPRFVVLEHRPAKPRGTVVLVGKGITFDSGGISIKPSDKMEDMKFDKCGACAVLAAVVAARRLDLPLHVVALAPFTENLPSGSSYKPGDVVTTMGGKTIEIINTDAEGRVILADALHYGSTRWRPDAMVELSTLTGGCIVAVGHHAIAGMGNSDDLLNQLVNAGNAVNERVWPMPFFDEYGEMVKSRVADVKNSAGRVASAITAGKFLQTFVGDHPWVHLDIASTAYHEGGSPRLNDEYCPEQATGVGVRLLVEWMRHWEKVDWEPKAPATPAARGARTAGRRPSRARGPRAAR